MEKKRTGGREEGREKIGQLSKEIIKEGKKLLTEMEMTRRI